MPQRKSAYRGCLLGLAVGDAMGYTVDDKSYDQICADYGPNGLMGYDLVNGYADVTSHTQIAAFTANSLLMGTTRGQLLGRMAPFVRYIERALQEWAQVQHTRREPDKPLCWVCRVPELRRRRCMDTRMLDTLTREQLGTPEEPANHFATPGALVTGVAVGLFFHPERMEFQEIGRLGAEALALTHGESMAFLSGSVLAYAIAGILHDPDTELAGQFLHAAEAVAGQFGRDYPQALELRDCVVRTVSMTKTGQWEGAQAMNHLKCETCAQVLCGAIFAALTCGGDFDAAMITAVNHSGCSAAVGALTGAILGARYGEEALPEFYLECLEPVEPLRTLADDLAQGCPLDRSARLFDDDWDRKYIQGELLETTGWAEE